MSYQDDFLRVAELVDMCAKTMKAISRRKGCELVQCPFRHVVLELQQLAVEIEDIATDLPQDWKTKTV